MIEQNQAQLRQAANKLAQTVGNSNEKLGYLIPVIDECINQVKSALIPIHNPLSQQNCLIDEPVNDEKRRIAIRLNGFDTKENRAWKQLSARFGKTVKQNELTTIAQVIAQHAQIKLDRDARRRKSVLLKWFDENWNAIEPFLDYVVLADSDSEQNQQFVPPPSQPALPSQQTARPTLPSIHELQRN